MDFQQGDLVEIIHETLNISAPVFFLNWLFLQVTILCTDKLTNIFRILITRKCTSGKETNLEG